MTPADDLLRIAVYVPVYSRMRKQTAKRQKKEEEQMAEFLEVAKKITDKVKERPELLGTSQFKFLL